MSRFHTDVEAILEDATAKSSRSMRAAGQFVLQHINLQGTNPPPWVQAHELLEDLSEACLALQMKIDPRRRLTVGDTVLWHDPDGGECSREGQIKHIEHFYDHCRITFVGDAELEAPYHELEIMA